MFLSQRNIFCGLFLVILFVVSMPANSYAQKRFGARVSDDAAEFFEQSALVDIDAYPVTYHGFKILPKLEFATEYTSNVFAVEDNEDSDLVASVLPSINIQKEIRDHVFNIDAGAAIFRYLDNTTENIENVDLSFNGHLTANRLIRLPYSIGYSIDHKQRNVERTLNNTREPIRFSTFKGEVGLEYSPNRFYWHSYARFEQERLENGESLSGNVLVREDGDFNSTEVETRIGYETGSGWSPFLGVTVGSNDFLRRSFTLTGFDGVSRDNDFVTVLGGLGFNYQGIVIGEVAVGQSFVKYSDPAVRDIDALAVQGSLQWQIRERTLLDLQLSRRVREDNLLNTGIVESEVLFGVDHELDRDLFLRSFVRYQNDDFDVGGREDNIYTGSVGLYYILNPRLQFNADITRRNRSSNFVGGDFKQNVFRVGLTGIF